MSAGRGRSKAKIEMARPELPPFLQRIRQQLVENEDADRRERSEKRRRERPDRPEDPSDEPTIVKIGDEDLTEEQYKRMKKELETQYKLDEHNNKPSKPIELDVDALIQNRNEQRLMQGRQSSNKPSSSNPDGRPRTSSSSHTVERKSKISKQASNKPSKTISYGSSSSSDDED